MIKPNRVLGALAVAGALVVSQPAGARPYWACDQYNGGGWCSVGQGGFWCYDQYGCNNVCGSPAAGVPSYGMSNAVCEYFG